MKYKNYYKILELKSDRVTEVEIKNAYRKLAKKYHPDINPGDVIAGEKFKDVNEAYQVLGDEVSKRKYDRIHNFYRVKDTFEDTKQKLNSDGLSEMLEMMFGKKESITVNKKIPNKNLPIAGEDLESQIDITLKEAFLGTEKKLAFKTANGNMKSISLKVPKGIRNNEKIRIAGQGKPGQNGGKNGDLYIKTMIVKDNIYELNGSDICMNLKLSPWEAVLGCKVQVQGIDSDILINVPTSVQSGEKLRVAGAGFWNGKGGRGDLLLNVQIMVPTHPTESEVLLFEKLGTVSKFEARKNITKEKE